MRNRNAKRTLPGFGLTLGYSMVYLSLIVLIPLGALVLRTSTMSWQAFVDTVLDERALASYRLTIGAALAGATANALFGLITAWVLVRYEFPGRRLMDGLIDLPLALPTAVSGIALAALYSQNGPAGRVLYALGLESAYSPLGVTIALTFIGLPFAVRTLEPVIQELDPALEEAASSLGAGRLRTLAHVVFPEIWPALLVGFSLAFARAVGEYGSVIFIAGNMPMKTEITSLLIVTKLEQYDYSGATALATVMLCMSFFSLLLINGLQWYAARHRRT